MALGQQRPVTPPTQSDLTDFAGIIQQNLSALFQAAHVHVGQNGPFTADPKPTDGAVGDVVMGVVAGSAYLYIKTGRTQWFKFGPATAV